LDGNQTLGSSERRAPGMESAKLRVAIAGAGFGGISVAVRLKLAGIEDFTVFECSPGPGGVWHDNTYPGCEVDTASIIYSFSFLPYNWPRTHGKQRELEQYSRDIIDYFEMGGRFRFNTSVVEAVWSERRNLYEVLLSTGERQEFEVVVSAVGMFATPNIPQWAKGSPFTGKIFHSARWQHDYDFTGRRVAVVGTGCTATQIVPELAEIASQVHVFQREPGWILPKGERDYTDDERRILAEAGWRWRIKRYRAFYDLLRKSIRSIRAGSPDNVAAERTCLSYIEAEIRDPELRKMVTPSYPFGCKRPIKSTTFYKALNRENVHLVPRAVAGLNQDSIIDADRVEREVDAVVLATGFHADDYLGSLTVVGRSGIALHEYWNGEPEAYLGLTVSGYPNFFMSYGPNTNGGGPITAQHERQAEAIVSVIKRMRRRGFRWVDTKPQKQRDFVRWVDRENGHRLSAVTAGCHNYFFSASGRNVTQWPTSNVNYLWRTRLGMRFGLQAGR
jgi:cation diffusion facilitator CzcD-associated flavoprotein CzcO